MGNCPPLKLFNMNLVEYTLIFSNEEKKFTPRGLYHIARDKRRELIDKGKIDGGLVERIKKRKLNKSNESN